MKAAYAQTLIPALADTPLTISTRGAAVALVGAAAYATRRMTT